MDKIIFIIALGIVFIVCVLLIISYFLFRLIFKKEKKTQEMLEQSIPHSPFHKHQELLLSGLKWLKNEKSESVSIIAKDGKKLVAEYYDYHSDTTFILIHGYHSSGKMDYAYFMQQFIKRKYNILLISQRGHFPSGGKYITFGCLEKEDLLLWIAYIQKAYPSRHLFLYGTSMGSATIAAASNRLSGISGMILDCGYTSPKEIIRQEMKNKRVPLFPFYYLIAFYCRWLGHFSLKQESALKSLQENHIPTFLIHGQKDRVVPFEMGKKNYEACVSYKEFFIGKEANHAETFYLYTSSLCQSLESFIKHCMMDQKNDENSKN